ncbi:LysR family transcriptional regulator [Labrys neptuniae]
MDNRAGEMEVFVAAAELRGFSAAGRKLHLSPSAVSKLVTRIEDRLGARLLVRTTRALQLTPEGETYLARAQIILADIAETERMISSGGQVVPSGRLRVSASVGFGARCVVPVLPDFLARYPKVELDLSLTDDVIDLVEEKADIAIRSGPLRDSSLKARKIVESPRVITASPDYLARHGVPRTPEDLAQHNCLLFNFRRGLDSWPFRDPGVAAVRRVQVTGNFTANNGPTLRKLCLDGLGLVRLGRFHVQPDLETGRLVPVLEDYNARDIEPFHAVFVGHEHLAARIRAFVDFLAERIGRERQ